MFKTLFFKECKEMLKSITYYIFLACIIIFFVSQMADFKGVAKPIQGQENYGFKYSGDESVIMQSTINKLASELSLNSFPTYPIMFYKEVKLKDEEMSKVYEILKDITGINKEQLIKEIENHNNTGDNRFVNSIKVKDNIKFQEFSEKMNKIDDILGGGSYYNSKKLYGNGEAKRTYEDALKDYESIINNDKVSRAYARLFSDYMGIVLAILPIFLAVTRVLKDKRAKAAQVIFSKKCSSTVIILSRYLAIISMIIFPLILISITPTLQSIYSADSNGITADYFAFIRVIFGWLMPSVLVTVSMGFFLTELTNGPVAILVQGIWWFVSISLGGSNLVGNVGMNLIPRFNALGSYDIYNKIFNELVINRVLYSIVAIVLIVGTIFIYDTKRKGELNLNGKILKNS
ncbi:ABC transporter permease [Clostridium sporogenes]|uniref:ABC transporter permease n=1 Tax=Clostridium sporogenes TaxID=1509 RepID=A0AAE4JRA0_CLOSG|nr:ABC transporter permease [Clostridium sporogenes]MDS1001941.1 ABC transporter permease [Clostridium sporogenes]